MAVLVHVTVHDDVADSVRVRCDVHVGVIDKVELSVRLIVPGFVGLPLPVIDTVRLNESVNDVEEDGDTVPKLNVMLGVNDVGVLVHVVVGTEVSLAVSLLLTDAVKDSERDRVMESDEVELSVTDNEGVTVPDTEVEKVTLPECVLLSVKDVDAETVRVGDRDPRLPDAVETGLDDTDTVGDNV